MRACSLRLQYTMAFCELRDKYTDALLRHRLKRAGYSNIPKAVEKYCRENKEVRRKLGDWHNDDTLREHHRFWYRYNLCHLKDPRTIDLAYSTAFCNSREQQKDCFLEKTGHLPTERSKMIDWLCRENFSLSASDPTVKGDLFEVARSCYGGMSDCATLATARQVQCLPVKNVSPTVTRLEMVNHSGIKWTIHHASMKNLECLLAVNERAANDCFNQTGLQVWDGVNTAICNSNQHFYFPNTTGCLLSHKVDPEYISTCKNAWRYGLSIDILLEMYELTRNCNIPLYGKVEVEECSLKHLNQSFWTSRDDFSNWLRSNSSHESKFVKFRGCLSKVRRPKQLDEKYDRCSHTLHFKREYEKYRQSSCRGQDDDVGSGGGLIRKLNCKIQVGAINRSDECSRALDNFKSINETVTFSKWMCDGANEDGFIQLSQCCDEMPQDKLYAFRSCVHGE